MMERGNIMGKCRCYGCMKIKSAGSVCEYCGYDESVLQNEAHQLQTGTVLKGQYLIGRVLGQGGFGITYIGWDFYRDLRVTVKEYFPNGTVMRDHAVSMELMDYSKEENSLFVTERKRFLKEAQTLDRLSGIREVVRVEDSFLDNNTAYIVMEYVEGITLKQYVKKQGGRLSPRETFRLLEPVMTALCKVHKTGIIHRDISPDNIMLCLEGGIKLLDFGAMKDVGDIQKLKELTKSTEAVLKQGYAPVEQYQKRGELGAWTDVYALCATFFYCMTGEVPLDALARLLGEEEIHFREYGIEISARKEEVLRRGLELRSKDRISDMEELYRGLFEKEPDYQEVRELKKLYRYAGIFALCMAALFTIAFGVPDDTEGDTKNEKNIVRSNEKEDKEGNTVVIRSDSGKCGKDVCWEFDADTKTLTLSGTGGTDYYCRVEDGGERIMSLLEQGEAEETRSMRVMRRFINMKVRLRTL